jgi:hypothetical protein
VAIPTGGAKLEGLKVLKLGDVVELPGSNLVVQVTNARLADLDATRDWLLADVVIGNKGKEKEPISSVVSFDVVTADWKWHGLDLSEAIAKISTDVASGKEPALFDADVEPGKAVKGTARIPVPKAAKGLALVYHSTKVIALPNEPKDPYVFVSLGIRGDWPGPGVPEDAAEFKAGTVYKVGDSIKMPKSGLVVKVNAAWERTESIKSLPIQADQKYVLADISVMQSNKEWPFEPRSVLRIESADGKESGEIEAGLSMAAAAESTRYFSGEFGRGLVGARMAKAATGLRLKIAPTGPGKGEEVLVDLGLGGGSAVAPTTPSAAAPTAAAKASPTAAAMAKPTAAPKPAVPTQNPSAVPQELASFPVPSGFTLVPGSAYRQMSGGELNTARASWKGKTGVDDVAASLKQALAKDYELEDSAEGDGTVDLSFVSKASSNLYLDVSLYDDGEDTVIEAELYRG